MIKILSVNPNRTIDIELGSLSLDDDIGTSLDGNGEIIKFILPESINGTPISEFEAGAVFITSSGSMYDMPISDNGILVLGEDMGNCASLTMIIQFKKDNDVKWSSFPFRFSYADGLFETSSVPEYPAGTGSGVGIKSIETFESEEDGGENLVTILQTDGTLQSFVVRNGNKGSDGSPGRDGEPGYTPIKGYDYFTESEICEIINRASSAAVAEASRPYFADDMDWLNANGEPEKIYVLPDGHIYAYLTTHEYRSENDFLKESPDTQANKRQSTNAETASGAAPGYLITNYIEVDLNKGSPCNAAFYGIKSIIPDGASNNSRIFWYDENKNKLFGDYFWKKAITKTDDYQTCDLTKKTGSAKGFDGAEFTEAEKAQIKYVRFTLPVNVQPADNSATSLTDADVSNIKIFIDCNKTDTVDTRWTDTGHAYALPEYEDRISDLEKRTDRVESKIDNIKINTGADYQLPEYWTSHLNERISDIKEIQKSGGKNAVSFIWASDLHIPDVGIKTTDTNSCHSRTNDIGKVMAKVMDECDIPFAVISGDLGTQAAYSALDGYNNALSKIPEHLAPLWGTERLLACLGNHDGCYGNDPLIPAPNTYHLQFSSDELWHRYMRSQSLDFRRKFSDDGLYYYIDNEPQKIRFILLYSQFSPSPEYDRFRLSCYGQEQLDWLITTLEEMPEGYGAVVITHVPPLFYGNAGYSSTNTPDQEVLRGILNAYKKKTTYTGEINDIDDWTSCYVEADFRHSSGEMIAMFCGHCHFDSIFNRGYITSQGDSLSFPILSITAAGYDVRDYADENRTAFKYPRTSNSATETAFDVVTINRNERRIYCTRIGAGGTSDLEVKADRTVQY